MSITTTDRPINAEWMDPSDLLVADNVRTAKLDPDLLASVQEHGVLQPIVAIRTDDGVLVRMGHRRRLAAIKAGVQVPVMIFAEDQALKAAAPLASIDRILQQWAENQHREDLTAADEAKVVQDLLDLGVTVTQVAKRTRLTKDQVAAAQAVSGSKVAAATSAKYQALTLDQLAAVAEFEHSKDAVKLLVEAAAEGEGHFKHQLQRLRDQRDDQAAKEELAEKLRADGIAIFKGQVYENRKLAKLADIEDGNGKTFTEKSHKACPGHAAVITYAYDGKRRYKAEYYCTDPRANGHKRVRTNLGSPAADPDERKTVLANNKAWRSAEKVRRAWLRDFLARPKAPDDWQAYVFGELAVSTFALNNAFRDGHKAACELLGVKPGEKYNHTARREDLVKMMAAAKPARQQMVMLGMVLAAYEGFTDVSTWRHADGGYRYDDAWAPRYLAALVSWGYEPSEIEQYVIDGPARAKAKQDANLAASDPGQAPDAGQKSDEPCEFYQSDDVREPCTECGFPVEAHESEADDPDNDVVDLDAADAGE